MECIYFPELSKVLYDKFLVIVIVLTLWPEFKKLEPGIIIIYDLYDFETLPNVQATGPKLTMQLLISTLNDFLLIY